MTAAIAIFPQGFLTHSEGSSGGEERRCTFNQF